ncbi:cytochrome P450 4V2 [Caerostris extrusa]|uniref:Cytochrome P450 4V2 n=1 Tax=Caerostris extrusa TaxID=172846 RepID=A0AAV4M3Q4_CAEEX|nr:cytochrome P450 4V2 [Caerostris extrusa]
MDSILFVTSGKKNALHVYIMKYFREKSKNLDSNRYLHTGCVVPDGRIIGRLECGRTQLEVSEELGIAQSFISRLWQRFQDDGSVERKRIIEKSDFYDYFKPYMGTGIATCDSSQWKERRKLLAPGFQNSILRGYLTVFNEHAQKLVEFLHEETGKEFTCVESPISLCSLDIVCETILGVKIGALQNEAREYVSSLRRLLDSTISRIWKFWQWPTGNGLTLYFTAQKPTENFLQHIRIAHGFSRSVRRQFHSTFIKKN